MGERIAPTSSTVAAIRPAAAAFLKIVSHSGVFAGGFGFPFTAVAMAILGKWEGRVAAILQSVIC
jgi:hypothetical protein